MSSSLRKIIEELALPLDLPWSAELARRDFSGALAKIDAHLVSNPEDIAARLWWVQCQAEIGSVPATALSAPLEEIFPKLLEENRLFEGSVAAFLRVSERLLERGQTKLAVVLLERAYDFASKGRSFPGEVRTEIHESLRSTLRAERERAELKRESRLYLDSLDRKLAEFTEKKEESPAPVFTKPSSRLSAKSVLESALAERGAAAVESVPSTSRHTRQALLIFLLGGLMILLGLIYSKIFSSAEPAEERLAVNRLPSGYPALVLPEPVLSEGLSLDSVSKRLERMKKEEVAAPPTPGPGFPSAPPPVWTPVQPEPRVRLSLEERRKLPEMNPDKLAGAVVESLGDGSGRNPAPVVTGPDGRSYGPPPALTGSRSLDGSQLQPVEVQQLPTPKVYRVIAPTSVFSAPSVVAQSVARLERDAKVQVVAKLGKWLELRSTGGRRGYIYAQDAVPSD
jgi:hypothetical protein